MGGSISMHAKEMDSRGVYELPMKLMIIMIVMAVTIAAVLSGLGYYSQVQTEANAKAAVQAVQNQIVNVYAEIGSAIGFEIDIAGAGWGTIDYIRIGDRLDPARPTDEGLSMRTMIQWDAGQYEARDMRSAGGASIVATSAGLDDALAVMRHDQSIGTVSPSNSGWSQQMELREGHYHLGIASLAWDSDGDGQATDTFILIYGQY